ncbi:MAG TPA: hypothetical protein PLC98_12790 [Anaerolineales bacterium]|nr:hypothetical protein [Anaerolineales bacterium]
MKAQVLHIDPHDDYHSVCDKMAWARAQRLVLVWPTRGDGLRRRLDLVLLHRQAHQLGTQLGIVAQDPVVREHAQGLGVPVFDDLRGARRRWRSRIPRLPPQRRSRPLDREALRTVQRARQSQLQTPTRRSYLWRVPILLVGLAAIAALVVVLVPEAVVRVPAPHRALEAQVTITANPGLLAVEAEAGQIPARALRVEVQATGYTPVTGQREAPSAAANGRVVFTNLTGAALTIPAGTRVRTTSGSSARFATVRAATLPARIGATADAEVLAVDLGPVGNVGAGQINAIDGPLGLQLAVTNPAATQGGALAPRPAVVAADQASIRAQLEAQLVAEAETALQTQLQPGEFLPPETITTLRVVSESYDHAVGEPADALGLTLRLAVEGLAIFEDDARAAGAAALAREVPAGYRQVPDALGFSRSRDTAVREGQAEFILRVTGEAEAVIETAEVRTIVAGLPPAEAAAALQKRYGLTAEPEITVTPRLLFDLWPRLPWVTQRIVVAVDAP